MRILHFSDLHIGVENYSRTDAETGLSTRLLDFLGALDELVEYALNEDVDLVLFAGDAYKGRDPSQTHQREFAKRLARLSAAGIPTFLLVGNHDLHQPMGRATAVEIFRTLDVPNVIVGDMPHTYVVTTRSGPLQIAALPWPNRSRLLNRDDSRGLSLDEVTAAIERICTEGVQREASNIDPSIPAVFTAHVTLNGASTGTEQNMMLGRDHTLYPSVVHRPEFDYVALGHIHKHQVLREGPIVAYSGSLQRVDFSEEADTKGFCVVDIDPSAQQGQRMTDFKFRPVSARRFLTIESRVPDGVLDPTSHVIADISRHDVSEAVVRLTMHVSPEMEPLLRDADIQRALEPAHHVASINREVPRERRTRVPAGTAEGMTPMEALDLYFESRKLEPARRDKLMRYAQDLMPEESEEAMGPGPGEHRESPV